MIHAKREGLKGLKNQLEVTTINECAKRIMNRLVDSGAVTQIRSPSIVATMENIIMDEIHRTQTEVNAHRKHLYECPVCRARQESVRV